MERKKYGKNEVIFRQGDPSGCMYRIESGKVGIVLDYESTVETDLTELAAGQFLGEMGLIEKTARSATAISLSDDTELQVIDEEDHPVGVCLQVEETNGAQNNLRIRKEDGSEVLIPYVKSFIREVSLEQRYIRIHVIEGLL